LTTGETKLAPESLRQASVVYESYAKIAVNGNLRAVGGKWGEATLKYGLLLECGGLTPLSPQKGSSRFQSKSDFAVGQSAARPAHSKGGSEKQL
jgi:hypothetical protein